MALTITQTKVVHRAGSLNPGKRFVQGELLLPVFQADSHSGQINWSDGGKGGKFNFIDGLTVSYQPANHTQIVTIRADAPGGSDSKSLSVFGTFPLYPQKGYQVEQDQETKTKMARDGTKYFSEQFKPQITWKLGADRRLTDELLEVWDFLIFHRKVKLFWVFDQERKLMNKVRRTSALPTTFESVNSWSNAIIVQGDYNPITLFQTGLADLRLNCGGVISGTYSADAFFVAGTNTWDFGIGCAIDDSGLIETPGFGVLRFCRYDPVQIDYDIYGLMPSSNYACTLYFAGPDSIERTVNIYLQGSLVSTDLVIPGGSHIGVAVEDTHTIAADINGRISLGVEYITGANAIVNAIKLIAV